MMPLNIGGDIVEAGEKKCPQCAEIVKAEARICRFCGHDFETAASSIATEAITSKAKGNGVGKGCLVLLGILIAVYLIGSLASPSTREVAKGDAAADALSSGGLSAPGAHASERAAMSSLTGPQANAARSAEQYLAMTGFSRKGLIEQLSSDAGNGYDVADATAAVDSLSVDWNEQAARSAKQYLQMTGFSCSGLIEQLSSSSGSNYTESQARYGAEQAGAC